MDFLFKLYKDYIICYVELGMDLSFSCLVSCICWFLAWFHIYVVFLMGFVFLNIN